MLTFLQLKPLIRRDTMEIVATLNTMLQRFGLKLTNMLTENIKMEKQNNQKPPQKLNHMHNIYIKATKTFCILHGTSCFLYMLNMHL